MYGVKYVHETVGGGGGYIVGRFRAYLDDKGGHTYNA